MKKELFFLLLIFCNALTAQVCDAGDQTIGCGESTYRLNVYDNSSRWTGFFNNKLNNSSVYLAQGGGNGMYLDPGNNTNGAKYAFHINNPYTSKPLFRIMGDGKVGINTDSLINRLNVNGDVGLMGGSTLKFYEVTNTAWASMWFNGEYLHENWPLYIHDKAIIDGSLGIGVSSTGIYKLKVLGRTLIDSFTKFGDGPYSIPSGNSIGQYGIFINHDGAVPRHVNYGGLGVAINRANWAGGYFSNTAGYSALFDQGVVGIGIRIPSGDSLLPPPSGEYKLLVNGSVKAKKLVIETTGWPDFVFAKTYQLRSLDNLEKFINKYNHLPDLPPAAEIEKKGVDIAETQAVLLKKIEELTLYVIALNNENKLIRMELRKSNSKKSRRDSINLIKKS